MIVISIKLEKAIIQLNELRNKQFSKKEEQKTKLTQEEGKENGN